MSTRRQIAELKAKELRKYSRKTFSVDEKLRIVLAGLNEDSNISELCQKEGISISLYKVWSKEFIEGGRSRLAGEYLKEDSSDVIQTLKTENRELKLLVAELILEVRSHRKIQD
jgi:transposase